MSDSDNQIKEWAFYYEVDEVRDSNHEILDVASSSNGADARPSEKRRVPVSLETYNEGSRC